MIIWIYNIEGDTDTSGWYFARRRGESWRRYKWTTIGYP
jgi:hypothetical protein